MYVLLSQIKRLQVLLVVQNLKSSSNIHFANYATFEKTNNLKSEYHNWGKR